MNSIINFHPRQAPMLELGRIPSAIRPRRTDTLAPQPGDLLYLYVGLNTPAGRLVRTEMCEFVADITIFKPIGPTYQVMVGSEMLDNKRLLDLAKSNGFQDDDSMIRYFDKLYGLPFQGSLLGWSAKPSYLPVH